MNTQRIVNFLSLSPFLFIYVDNIKQVLSAFKSHRFQQQPQQHQQNNNLHSIMKLKGAIKKFIGDFICAIFFLLTYGTNLFIWMKTYIGWK